jgi:hypothetical protein
MKELNNVEFRGRYQIKFSHRFAALRNLYNNENTSICLGKLLHKTSKSQESQSTSLETKTA